LRVSGVGGAPTYVARSLSSGLEAIVIEIPTRHVPTTDLIPSSVGLELSAEALIPGRNGTTRLVLWLTLSAFRDVFHALSEDIVGQLIGLETADRVAEVFVERVRRWQRFLAAYGSGELSDAERRGLFCELLVLRDLLMAGSAPSVVLAAWEGPEQGAHDFVLPRGDLEVKGTASLAPTAVSVSNLEQLDARGSARLVLLLTVLSENQSVGSTLPELVSEVADLTGDAVGEFRDRLLAVGYLETHAPRYQLPLYQVMGTQAFRVEGGFPRLVSENVPPGVMAARYSIALPALSPFALHEFHPSELLEDTSGH